MRKTGYYSANDCDFLEEGEKLRLEHDLRFQPNDKILLPLVNASDFDLYELRALAVSGEKKVLKVEISPEAVDPEDVETLEDMILASTNQALEKAEEESKNELSKFTGGLGF